MKHLVWIVVAALGMSTTSFAGNRTEGKEWKMNVNVTKLSRYLNLDVSQAEEVAVISDYFAEKMQGARYAKATKQGKKLREAVYGNLKLMKRTLTDEQYRKYVQLVNVTLRNRGLDAYWEEMAER